MPESVPFNINFEAVGIESTFLIANIGSIIWVTFGFIILALICLILKKVKCIWDKLGKKIFFNGIARYIITNQQVYALLCMINIAKINLDTVYLYEKISNYLAIGFLAAFQLFILIFIIIAIVKMHQWNEEKFINRFGGLLDGMKIKKEKGRKKIVIFLSLYILRKLVFAICIVYLSESFITQMGVQIMFALGIMIFI